MHETYVDVFFFVFFTPNKYQPKTFTLMPCVENHKNLRIGFFIHCFV